MSSRLSGSARASARTARPRPTRGGSPARSRTVPTGRRPPSKSLRASGSAVTRVACVRKSSSTARRARSWPASVGPPSQSRKRTPRSRSAAEEPAQIDLRVSEGLDLGAGGAHRRDRRRARWPTPSRRAARPDARRTGLPSGSSQVRETTIASGWRSRPGIDGANGSTRRVPGADHHRAGERSQVDHERAVGARADLRSALVADPAVGGHHEVERDVRPFLMGGRLQQVAMQRSQVVGPHRAETRELRH